jgi:hypothetical protein
LQKLLGRQSVSRGGLFLADANADVQRAEREHALARLSGESRRDDGKSHLHIPQDSAASTRTILREPHLVEQGILN